jgi:hypothetical protein
MLSYFEENQVILQITGKFSVDCKGKFWCPVSAFHIQELFNWAKSDNLLLVPVFAVSRLLVDWLLLIQKITNSEY